MEKIRSILKMTIQEVMVLVVIALVVFNLSVTVNIYSAVTTTNKDVEELQKNSYNDTYYRGDAGLKVIEKNGLTTTEQIEEFYKIKPAGKSDLHQMCINEEVRIDLSKIHDPKLIKNSCNMFEV